MACALFRFENHLKLNQRSEMMARVNYWLCRQRMGDLDAVRNEVARWDTSALAPEFRLAQIVLSGRLKQGLDFACQLVSDRLLRLDEELLEWPLLSELRELDGFDERVGALREHLEMRELQQDSAIQMLSPGAEGICS